MRDIAAQDLAGKLLSEGFTSNAPLVGTLTDPIAETQVIATLDELAPYELDPRLTRNPRYDEIKESIRERGLDAPSSSLAAPEASTTSSAMVGIHGWPSCANYGRRPRMSVVSVSPAYSVHGRSAERSSR